MANKNKNGDWIDTRGQAVPTKYVPDQDKKRDQAVEVIINRALKLQKRMADTKKDFQDRVNAYIRDMYKKYDIEFSRKGNITLTNFSGTRQIEFAMDDIITFDETLSVAKAQIDQCLNKWAEGANQNLIAVVNQAFEVDKKGRINKAAILKLRTLNVKDNAWKKAMDTLTNSVKVEGTRQYMILRHRPTPDARFETISLNFSSM